MAFTFPPSFLLDLCRHFSSWSRSHGEGLDVGPGRSGPTHDPFPGRRFPPEILEQFFLRAVDFESRPVKRSCRLESDTARSVSQVCRQWRRVALGSTALWAQALDPDTNTLLWVKVVLERCNAQPLALVSTFPSSSSQSDIKKWALIQGVFARFKYIYIELTANGSDPRRIRDDLLSCPAHCLLDATILWDSKDLDPDSLSPLLTRGGQPLFADSAPNLRRLHLVNCTLPVPIQVTAGAPLFPIQVTAGASFSFPALRTLSIESTPRRRESFSRASAPLLFKMLQAHTSLTHLNLIHCVNNHRADELIAVPQLRFPFLQDFSYHGAAAVFLLLTNRLELPLLCNKHVFIDFEPFKSWSKQEVDDLIAQCLNGIPILPYNCMAVCTQQKRLYISFNEPVRYEVSFDIRECRHNNFPSPTLARDILISHPEAREYTAIDYFGCAAFNWIMQHPGLYRNIATLRYGSTNGGVSAVLMLYLLWAFPNLERFHAASCRTLRTPHLLKALVNEAQAKLPRLDRLRCLTIPLCAVVDMSAHSDLGELEDLRQKFQGYAVTSVLSAIQRIEVAISPEMARLCGPSIGSVVEERIKELGELLSPRAVSWNVVDDSWFNYPVVYRLRLSAPDEGFLSFQH